MIVCPRCNTPITNTDIDARQTARCPNCQHQFSVAGLRKDAQKRTADAEKPPLPKGMTRHMEGETLVLVRKWGRLRGTFYFLMYIPILLVTVVTLTRPPTASCNIIFNFLLILWCLFYLAEGVQELLNTTVIRMDAHQVVIRHAPVRTQVQTIENSSMRQIYVKKSFNTKDPRFHLMAIMKGGKQLKLISNLSWHQAFYITQQLEKYLEL